MNDHSDRYTLDEAFSSIGFGKFQVLALAYAGLGWTSASVETMLLSFIGPALQSNWDISAGEESFLSTVFFAGMLVGSYFWGLISDTYGRRKGILGSLIILVGAGLLTAFSPNYRSLVILRCLVGFGVGGGQIFALWFIEFVPTHNRGTWMTLYTCFWTLGAIIEASLGWIIMPRLGWRWLAGFSVLPALTVLFSSAFILESPRYLCVKGRTIQAHQVLEKVAQVNLSNLPLGILISEKRMELDEEHAPTENTPLLSSERERKCLPLTCFVPALALFSTKLIRITLLLWVLYFGNMFLYYGIILMTSELSSGTSTCSTQSKLAANKNTNLYINIFLTSLAEVPGHILAALMVEKVGRKLSIKIMLGMGFIVLLPLLWQQTQLVTTTLLISARMFISAAGSTLSTYTREVYPTSVRSTGVGIASSIGRIGGMICPFVAVELVRGCHQAAAITLFEAVVVLLGFCTLFFPFDTKGRQLTDTISDHK